MADLSEDQARAYMHKLLAAMSQAGGSDLFISDDFPPSMKAHGEMRPLASQKLTGEVTRKPAREALCMYPVRRASGRLVSELEPKPTPVLQEQ